MKKGPSLLVRLTIYPLVALIFVAIALYIMLISFGYTINFQDGKITTTKTGIIIIASNPGDANVYINDDLYRKKTSALPFFNLKINRLPAAEYQIKIEKEGYITWEGSVNVKPGYVTWLNYILMIPEKTEEKPFNLPGEVKKIIASSDNNILIVSAIDDEQKIQTLWRIDTVSKNKSKVYESPILEKSAIDPVLVSYGNDRLLYKEIVDKKESLKVRELKSNGQSWDITSQFGVEFENIYFSPYSHDELYGLRVNNLYKINFVQKNMSASLSKEVIGIYPNENEMLLVQNTKDNFGLWKIERNNDLKNIIKAIPASKNYQITFSKESNYYLVYVADEKDLLHYSNGARNPTLETIGKDVTYYRLSSSARRVLIKSNSEIKTYDIEEEKYFDVIKNEKIIMLDWIYDDSSLVYIADNQIFFVNYNGFYHNKIFETKSDLFFLVSPSGNNIYFTDKTVDKKTDLFVISL